MDRYFELTRTYQIVLKNQATLHKNHITISCLNIVLTSNTPHPYLQKTHVDTLEVTLEDASVDELCFLVDQYLYDGGSRILLSAQTLQGSWQQQGNLVYRLLTAIGKRPCDLLLLDYGPNTFSGLLYGAANSLVSELPQFRFNRLTTYSDSVIDYLPAIFERCFTENARQYYFDHSTLSTGEWQVMAEPEGPVAPYNGTVLITGGGGAIGQLLAHHLSYAHDCQVFLVGRKPLTQDLIARFKQSGAKAYLQADCTKIDEMQAVCNHICEQYGALNYIFHLAGTLNDTLFINKTRDSFIQTLEAKVNGAEVVTRLAELYKPRSVCFFSSLSAVLGNIGQTDYAAANAYLNELAQIQNENSVSTWYSINWGLWETELGMQMQHSEHLKAMRSKEALKVLDIILTGTIPVTAVYKGNSELLSIKHSGDPEQKKNFPKQFSEEKARLKLRQILTDCTKIKNIDDDVSLLERGVDSIIATHIAIHLEKEIMQTGIACKIPKTLVFQYATFNQIYRYLTEQHADALSVLFPDTNTLEPVKDIMITAASAEVPLEPSTGFAIIAMSGEFPEALDLNELWQILEQGQSAIKPIPKHRWDWQADFSMNTDEKGKSYCRHGGFIQQAAMFDNSTFKITPRDALKLTPEVRRLLHQSHYALEHCNHLSDLKGEVAVFVANMYSHYQNLNKEKELIDSSLSAMANHISYAFNFNGPSIGVDSMCSGGLSALHMALNSLTLNECKAALVGAANIMSHPGKYRFLSEGKFLSPTGKCHSFGISADGYVPGEGCVVLVIKRLDDALKNNDKILGIIRGSAINSIGTHSGMTVPSANAQSRVIKNALAKSNIKPQAISYIETHGTGTSLGDPIEIEGLKQVFGANQNTISIGSLKSNIGHLESVAGLASIVKVLLQMHYRMKVPSINCDIENPLLLLDKTPFRIQKKLAAWGEDGQTLYAGVSAFGAGGSNAHVILESPPITHRYQSVPIPVKRLNSKSFWAELYVKPTNIKINEMDSTQENPNSLWLTKSIQDCSSPLIAGNAPHTTTLFLVSQRQKLLMHPLVDESCFLLLEEIRARLDNYNPPVSGPGLVLINLTALDDQTEENDYLQSQFECAKYLINTNMSIDLVIVNSLQMDTVSSVYKAAFDGLYRTLSLENPNITTTVIKSDHKLIDLFALFKNRIFTDKTRSKIYHLRQSHWQTQHFVENDELLHQKQSPLLRTNGVYVISGGFGALGLIITRHLLQHYGAHIICLGRSELRGDKLTAFNQLQSISSRIEYHQVDITDYAELNVIIQQIGLKHGRLNGVIHSACVLRDSLLKEKSLVDFTEVINIKIQGTINLDEATKQYKMDFFTSFSSMSAIYSNVGQADYCTANTFVDYFTTYRNELVSKNLRYGRSFTINWPLWQVDGLSLSSQTIQYLCEATGINPLTEKQGIKLFTRLMDNHYPEQILPLQGEPGTLRKKLLSDTAQIQFAKPVEDIVESVVDCITEVTHIERRLIHGKTSINDLGMSSVLLTELATLLEKKMAVAIAPSAFFTYNTVEKIADYIQQKSPQIQRAHQSTPHPSTGESDDCFAIIGLSALLPGGSEADDFWLSLINNQSAIKRVERWSHGEYYAATLDNIRQFDNQFFNLSNKEAMLMDPQHRLFLQTSYKALLDAGYPPAMVNNVGVFAGVQFNDYQNLLRKNHIPQHPYLATGNSHAMLANRVSYLFDFNGPSQTVDTACSSTLVAINRGLLALKNNECDMVLCGAVSLLIDSEVTDAANSMGVLSPNYRCATFDEQADGYVRGEGVGVFVIKRLSDAVRDKDAIHAVIASFAEKHGGRANSLTAPNPIVQKELLLKAYNNSLANQVGYIETHGTGTRLGDPVEIDALIQAFRELAPNKPQQSVFLGSVKTNVGHLEPAAGVASLIKVIYSLKHKQIPANLHFNHLNSYIELAQSPFEVVTKNQPWNSIEPLVAGVSSFGFGGSYAHLILKEAPKTPLQLSEKKQYYIILSARHKNSLSAMKKNLAILLEQNKDLSLESLSYMLCCRREHFNLRFACLCTTIDELIERLGEEGEMTHYQDESLRAYLNGEPVNWDNHFTPTPPKIHTINYVFNQKDFWFDDVLQ